MIRHTTLDKKRMLLLLLVISLLGLIAVSGSPAVADPGDLTVIDDFEDGDASDWLFFGGNNAGGGGGVLADRPQEGSFYFSTGWGGEGTASGFYGGAFKNFENGSQVALPPNPWFNVWILNQSNATVDEYTLEITIREDLDGDGWTNGAEDSFRLDATFPSSSFDDQWTLISAPVSDFADQFTGGDGTFNGDLDEIVIVVAGVAGAAGSTVELDFDLFAFEEGPAPGGPDVIDDFEGGLPSGADGDGAPIGFYTFQGAGSGVAISTAATPPAPVLPAVGEPNNVLQMNIDSTSFAGFIHAFENAALDTWVPQDWSTREGFSLWFHGSNSGAGMFIDILDNRNPGSTSDDAERWTVAFTDDFTGWQLLEFPFADFVRKEIGNGAPNDGFGRFAVHGWALGGLGTNGPQVFYMDQVSVYGEAEPPALAVNFALTDTPIEEGTTGNVAVKLNRPFGAEDPAQVSVDFATDISGAIPGEEYTPTSGTLVFTNGGPTELTFPIETFDDTKFEGDERIVLRLSNPVDVELGALQARAQIVDNDPFNPLLVDDFERGAFLWDVDGPVEIDAKRVTAGDTYARPGQDAIENVLEVVATPLRTRLQDARNEVKSLLPSGNDDDDEYLDKAVRRLDRALNMIRWSDDNRITKSGVIDRSRKAVNVLLKVESTDTVPLALEIADIAHDIAELALDESEAAGGDAEMIAKGREFLAQGEDQIFNNGKIGLGMKKYIRAWRKGFFSMPAADLALDGSPEHFATATVGRDFPIGQDWSGTQSLDFWFYGTGSGEQVTVNLKDNRAPDPGPAGWTMVWSDEFDQSSGAPPNPANWTHEIGDGALNGIEGWGNSELQYYTDDPANAATDGNGNLVITLKEADGEQCFYGDCEYTSARLLSWHKAEFAFGRIESRLRVPDGGAGLWPAFWSLGTDIDRVPWPAAGEIDFMEYVSRLPNEIFGTVHGPGYSGGNAFGNIYDFGEPVYNDYHTFTVDWQPDLITWYVDGIQYHQATPADVPGPWVYNKPFFLLLNFAIGGNFGGPPDPANTYPQEYLVDYVRVYQSPDTAERFEASFTDDTTGWNLVSVPIDDFTRSDYQPAGAPDDGLGLTEVWGYGFDMPYVATGTYLIDQVHRVPIPPPTELTVTTLADAGPGSLRDALGLIADGGIIDFDPALAGGTIGLSSGQLVVDRSVTIDGSAAPGVVVSGNDSSRVFQIEAATTVSMNDLAVADGAAGPQGGGILNLGTLSLDHVTVRDNTENSAGPPNFQFGGGGIYNGENSTLNLTDSTVADNTSVNQPGGGIYGFFGSTVNITRSTVSGNLSGDVAGGLRLLSNGTIVNSTFSGNTSTAWHGGGIFHTDGDLTVTNSTFSGNVAPAGTASGILVATFGAPANATLTNNVLEGNGGAFACAIEGGGAATITSGGSNVISDGSCNPIATDQSNTDALLEPLTDNGGPTLTHALGAGSPAIDAADAAFCPSTDQRDLPRPVGAGCDVGAFEVQ